MDIPDEESSLVRDLTLSVIRTALDLYLHRYGSLPYDLKELETLSMSELRTVARMLGHVLHSSK